MATRDPLQRMDVTQTAGAAFDIWLEVITCAVVTLMTNILLINFCGKELGRWPETVAENVFLQFKEECDIANQ